MYGVEEISGLGGLAAQASNPSMAGLVIHSPGSMVVGHPAFRGGTPGMTVGAMGGMGGPVAVSLDGSSVTTNPANQVSSWRQILDWHNSPAPWVLLLILVVYGWSHVAYKHGRRTGL